MAHRSTRILVIAVAPIALLAFGCAGRKSEPLLPAETFNWVHQPFSFASPPSRWAREGDDQGGWTGVRFVLQGGGGQCISLAANRSLAERDRRRGLTWLVARADSLTHDEFLGELGLARVQLDDPISEREAETARAINLSLERAAEDYEAGNRAFVASDLQSALNSATHYQPTLEELLPNMRLRPERMQEPDRWRLGRERDTVLAGLPAFASDDTLIAPEQTLLYSQVFWVVNGCAFKATFQGRQDNLEVFHRVVDSVRIPEPRDARAR
ncbi:MAG: hypothetical protein ACRENS_07315 [Candidatus Eiseniibacteriota bacterium]